MADPGGGILSQAARRTVINASAQLYQALLRERAEADLFRFCRVLKKNRVFRSGGRLHILEDVMFPGYVFIKTARPEALAVEAGKAGAFPQLLSFETSGQSPVPLEDADFSMASNIRTDGSKRIEGQRLKETCLSRREFLMKLFKIGTQENVQYHRKRV